MFMIGRVLDAVLSPVNGIFILIILSTTLLFTRRARLGRLMLSVICVFGLGLSLLPVDQFLAQTLESRFPIPSVSQVDGVVVLGGAIDMPRSLAQGRPSVNEAAERITEMVALMHRFPHAKIIYSGGSGNPFDQVHKEADVARRMLDDMGIDTTQIIFEDQSRNTHENAIYSKSYVAPIDGEVWLLVTSANHMPRAIGSFRAVGWPIVAWPVNFQMNGISHFYGTHRLQTASNTMHELIGLIYYRLQGWSPVLFPAP